MCFCLYAVDIVRGKNIENIVIVFYEFYVKNGDTIRLTA